MYMLVPKPKRVLFRNICAEGFELHPDNKEAYVEYVTGKVQELGGAIFWLTVISVLVQVAKLAYDIWKSNQTVKPTTATAENEPFGIPG